ncbi:hypothetical protein EHW64_13670 [Erwinia psidii]|nr:hypothetical protein [Erwinia psidii]
MTLDTAFQICLTIAATFGGLWVRSLQNDISTLEKNVERIKTDYQRREDARSEFASMMTELRYLRESIDRLSTKIEQKADK